MDQQLLVGILLIIFGVAVGLIAVAVVMNRRAERGEGPALSPAEAPAEQPTGEEFHEVSQPGRSSIEAPQIEHALEPAIVHSREIPGEAKIDREPAAVVPRFASEARPERQAGEGSVERAGPSAGLRTGPYGRQLVAEIYREEVSGELVVKLADKEYRNLGDIEDEQVREQLSSAASDLTRWFAEDLQPSHSPSEQRAPAPPAGSSMLEGINSNLQRSLATSGLRERGIRLVPDAAGGVKVLIGLKSFALDEVPDEEIRRLIRESVVEWEAGQ